MDANSARTENIRLWVAEAGGPTEFANTYGSGRWTQAQVSQWVSTKNPKGIGHALARALEAATGKPEGSMDRPPTDSTPSQYGRPDADTLEASIRFLEELFAAHAREFEAVRHTRLIAAVYSEMLAATKPNLVEMTIRYGKEIGDDRQSEAGRTGANGGKGAGKRSKAA